MGRARAASATAHRDTCAVGVACVLLALLALSACATAPSLPSLPPHPPHSLAPRDTLEARAGAERLAAQAGELGESGHVDEALATLDRAAALYRDSGAMWRAALLALPRARLALAAGRHAEALRIAEEGASLLGDTGDVREVVALRLVAGLAMSGLGRRTEAIGALEDAAALRQSLGRAAPLPETDLLLADLALALHRPELAAEACGRLEAGQPDEGSALAAQLHRRKARVHTSQGALASALAEHGRALTLLRLREDVVGALEELLSMAALFVELGKLDVAWVVATRGEALALGRSLPALVGRADALLGRIAEALGDDEEARRRYRAVVDRDGARAGVIAPDDALWAAAGLWRLCRDLRCGAPPATPRLDLDSTPPASATTLTAATLIAREEVSRGDREAAFELLAALERSMTRPLALATSWRVHFVMGLAYRELGQTGPARHHLELAAFGLEALRLAVDTSSLRRSLLRDRRDVFQAVVDAWVGRSGVWPAHEDVRRALVAAERTHSRELLELLLEREGPAGQGRPAVREVQHQRIAQQLVDELSISADHDPAVMPDPGLWDDVARIAHLAELWSGMRQTEAPTVSTGVAFSFDRVPDDLQRELTDGEAILSYLIGQGRSYVWVIRRDRIDLVPLAGVESIQPALEAYQSSLLQTRFADAEALREHLEAGRALTELLLDPVLDELTDIDRLVVATDGPLHDLPFSTLIGPAVMLDGVPDYAVRRFAITHVPSAAAWLLLRERAGRAERMSAPPTRLVAVGDPSWSPSDDDRSVEVRFHDGGVTFVSHATDIDALPALTGARRELRQIARVVGSERSTLMVGAEATDLALRAATGPDTRYLHFATHGLTDVKPLLPAEVLARLDPAAQSRMVQEEPALVLTPDPAHGEDGLLRLDEILGMELGSDLVVLAGCSTGRGWERMGSTTYGLGGAFLYAGSRRALVSQWSVADRQTSQLMVRMYEALGRTPDPARALRSAQLAMLGDHAEMDEPTRRGFGDVTDAPPRRTTRRSAVLPPFYWASFVVVGD